MKNSRPPNTPANTYVMTLLRDFSFCFCCCSSTPFYCLRHTHTQKPFSRLAATVAPASVRHMISNIRRHTRETSALCAPAFHHTSSSNSNREKCHKHEKQKTYIYCARNTQQLPKIQSTSHSYIWYTLMVLHQRSSSDREAPFSYTPEQGQIWKCLE